MYISYAEANRDVKASVRSDKRKHTYELETQVEMDVDDTK